ncbi:hypothetical protein [Secundilactobacillus folii]|uniref:Uncharacterized protein n=1 Tax=Secundilactobacillus folii TaxID=2678357 RepID=A0A7X2XWU4_9LACO|nr:hypothetical protein [Secundilactobacillus folii]MTV83064.1 hypothetical protein [Secundilactobacillus folii]
MKEIKVVGDIWTGKYQPALTGNRIVDTALLTQFCTKLSKWLSNHKINTKIQIEHEFEPLYAPSEDLYLIDANIINTLPDKGLQSLNFLPVKHQDLLHADPSDCYQEILSQQQSNLNQQQ